MIRFAVPVAFVFASTFAAVAQDNQIAGSWHSDFQVNGVAYADDLILQPNQQFSDMVASYAGRTLRTGDYSFDGRTLRLNVTDWEPKTLPQYHPTGTTGGYYTQEPALRPPNSTYQIEFVSPNQFMLRDATFGASNIVLRFDRTQ